ncbi:histidine kinase dimerization/phosphoacceptor domain -containing protein [Azospirillum sp. SYSU D00513]|uniref:sensor histidine kinase n=1 Tax=Azospirillum sp. SYSU D00513 TaxID=2812561 RepID=UPI001A969593|nr:histidine kinase dimerization/phosphoacceptor domain -containing protein [Azospirillum sp. SYSU D00513]
MSVSFPRTDPGADGAAAARPRRRAALVAVAMAGLLLVLVIVLTGLFVWQGQRDARVAVEARATSAAFTASSYVRWFVEANLQTLQRVADSIARDPSLLQAPAVKTLDDAVAALPGEVGIRLFDAEGRPVLSRGPATAIPDIAGSALFAELKQGRDWTIGSFMAGPEGVRGFPLARRIEQDGRFLGAALVFVPAELLARFWESMDIGPGSTVGLLRDDGWLVARYPVPDRPLNLSNYVLFTEILPRAPDGGVYAQDASPADGVGRIVGYRRVAGLPLVTVVGVPLATLDSGVWRRVAEIAAVAVPIWVGLLVLSLFTVRLLHREEQARLALADALEQNRMLFREIHHRVKNNLQTVTSLIQMQPGPAAAKEELTRRIAAMTAVHEHIYRSDQFDRIDVADYVRTLLDRLKEGNSPSVAVECDLASVVVGADEALSIGLIVNEVVTNAFKHAFPNGRSGTIRVTIEAAGAGTALLSVRDDGVGYRPGASAGMGSRLIQGLTRQIGGRCEFRNQGGTLFTLAFPLPGEAPLTERRPAEAPPVAPAA